MTLEVDVSRIKIIADDAALFISDAKNWPAALTAFDSAASTMGLWVKTKVQNLGSGPPPSPANVAGQRVESVDRFTYLRSDLHSWLLLARDTLSYRHRVIQSKNARQCLEGITPESVN